MYETFEHEADIGVRGIGNSIEEAFEEGAEAMFSIMVDLDTITPSREITVEVDAIDMPALFVEWLNALLSQIQLENLVFNTFHVKAIWKDGERYFLTGSAVGEELDAGKHHAKTEVKAATYSNLSVEEQEGKWTAQCIVDV